MTSINRPADQATSIQLRSEDLDFLFTQVSDPDLHTRNVSGFANNLTPGRAFWGNADQPFLRLTPAQFEPQTETQTSPNAVRTTSADGTTPLPNPRLISDVIGQQALDADGNTISTPNPVWCQPVPDVLRPVLRPWPRFLRARRRS